jgi:hypothetical protein
MIPQGAGTLFPIMRRRRLRAAGAALGLALISLSCDGSPSEPTARIYGIIVGVAEPKPPFLLAGMTEQLFAQANDSAHVVLPITSYAWSSSDTNVATVDQSGLVSARKVGTTYITAQAGIRSSGIRVPVSVPGVYSVDPDSSQMLPGQQRTLAFVTRGTPATPLPQSAGHGNWTSSNPGVATVDMNGVVTAVGAGRATISLPYDAGIPITVRAEVFVPSVALPLRFVQIAMGLSSFGRYGGEGGTFTCARTTSDIWCWGGAGLNASQLGTTAPIDKCALSRFYEKSPLQNFLIPCAMEPVRVEAPAPFTQLSINASIACGIVSDGRTYCWGDTQVFSGASPSRTPVLVSPTLRFASFEYPCGVTITHEGWCWGATSMRGTADPSATPSQVAGGIAWSAITGGDSPTILGHRCGLDTTGNAYCWGANDKGQLGTGSVSAASTTPVRVASSATFSKIVTATAWACALGTDGRLSCWGNGQPTPAILPSPDRYVSLSAFDNFMCAVTTAGVPLCAYGYDGSALSPAATMPFQQFVGSPSGYCGLDAAGTMFCRGLNESGQLGVGDQVYRNSPVKVLGQ